MRAFATVGTTRFDRMIESLLRPAALGSLKTLGVRSLLLQIGSSEIDPDLWSRLFEGRVDEREGGTIHHDDLEITFYRYKTTITEDMASADLIIGHAGAGTVLECMKLRKPLLVVINEGLMDNHQAELAQALEDGGHVICTVPEAIDARLQDPNLFKLVAYSPPDQRKVARFIDSRLGIVQD